MIRPSKCLVQVAVVFLKQKKQIPGVSLGAPYADPTACKPEPQICIRKFETKCVIYQQVGITLLVCSIQHDNLIPLHTIDHADQKLPSITIHESRVLGGGQCRISPILSHFSKR